MELQKIVEWIEETTIVQSILLFYYFCKKRIRDFPKNLRNALERTRANEEELRILREVEEEEELFLIQAQEDEEEDRVEWLMDRQEEVLRNLGDLPDMRDDDSWNMDDRVWVPTRNEASYRDEMQRQREIDLMEMRERDRLRRILILQEYVVTQYIRGIARSRLRRRRRDALRYYRDCLSRQLSHNRFSAESDENSEDDGRNRRNRSTRSNYSDHSNDSDESYKSIISVESYESMHSNEDTRYNERIRSEEPYYSVESDTENIMQEDDGADADDEGDGANDSEDDENDENDNNDDNDDNHTAYRYIENSESVRNNDVAVNTNRLENYGSEDEDEFEGDYPVGSEEYVFRRELERYIRHNRNSILVRNMEIWNELSVWTLPGRILYEEEEKDETDWELFEEEDDALRVDVFCTTVDEESDDDK